MLYPILTLQNNTPVIFPDEKIDQSELTLRAVAAASKLFARAEAEKARRENQTYGELWKAWAQDTGSYPEM